MEKYNVKTDKHLIVMSRDILMAQIGVKEKTGKNDGIKVEQYLKSVGLGKGNPYCMAGQYYCYAEAIKANRMDERHNPLKKTGLAVAQFNHAKKVGIKTDYKPAIDDLIVWVKPNGVNGHIERIIEVIDNDTVTTVAFNTSNGLKGSQSDGDGVFTRSRSITKKIGTMKVLGLIGFIPLESQYC